MPKSIKKKSAKKKTVAKATTAAKKKAKRYSPKEKTDLLTKYAKLRKAGATAQVASAKIGVPYITLRSWEKKTGKGKAPTQRSVHTELKKAVSASKTKRGHAVSSKTDGLTLITPNGYRIEGFTSADLIKVLKSI